MNKVTKIFAAIALAVALTVTSFAGNFAQAETQQETVTVVFTVEKFVIGQGFLIEPEQVTVQAGASIADVFKKVMDEKGYTYTTDGESGFYLEGINDADNGNAVVPESITGLKSYLEDWEPNEDANLEEGDYTMFSGWMFSQNGTSPDTYCSDVTVNDGDVIRLQFTLIWGSDIGLGDPEWTGIPNPSLADKEPLMKAAAYVNSLDNVSEETQTVYQAAIEALENYDATQQEIDEIYVQLKETIQTPDETETAKNETTTQKEATTAGSEATTAKNETAAGSEATTAKNETTAGSETTTIKNETTTAKDDSADKPQKISKVAVKKITWKKKTAKKITVSVYRVSGARGYQVKIFATKKNAKKDRKAIVKKLTKKNSGNIVIKSKKIKNKKNLFIRVRAYQMINNRKVFGALSGVRKAVKK